LLPVANDINILLYFSYYLNFLIQHYYKHLNSQSLQIIHTWGFCGSGTEREKGANQCLYSRSYTCLWSKAWTQIYEEILKCLLLKMPLPLIISWGFSSFEIIFSVSSYDMLDFSGHK
jgi:chitinase